jgi:DNA-binding transcriptional LysR family regulator
MELRHLRFFVAVAEEGSLTLAAEKRLHTAQPNLSRQMRELEFEVGAQLMTRSARGIELTAAERTFLDHARLALAQVDAAGIPCGDQGTTGRDIAKRSPFCFPGDHQHSRDRGRDFHRCIANGACAPDRPRRFLHAIQRAHHA